MAFRYVVLGAGRQGTAAGYDLARFGDAESVTFADAEGSAAERAASRVNELLGRPIASGAAVQVTDPGALAERLKGAAACVSAVPFHFNPAIARACVAAGCALTDLGGNSDCVREELALDAAARQAGVAIVPDCGVGPGMIANLAVRVIEQFDRADEVLIYDGGLPQTPRPPFNYACFFNIEGLTNEYVGDAQYLIDGKVAAVACFDPAETERIEIPELGELEAFTTSGALTTLTGACVGKLRTLKNKTLRYPGHAALMRNLIDLGFLSETAIDLGGASVVPRDLAHRLLADKFAPEPGEHDLMVIHIRARGERGGKPAEVTLDMLDRLDAATGFTAMERTTGFHAAIVAQLAARGQVEPGARPPEEAVGAARMIEELARRGINVTLSVS